jgi:hypothetical protein
MYSNYKRILSTVLYMEYYFIASIPPGLDKRSTSSQKLKKKKSRNLLVIIHHHK